LRLKDIVEGIAGFIYDGKL